MSREAGAGALETVAKEMLSVRSKRRLEGLGADAGGSEGRVGRKDYI